MKSAEEWLNKFGAAEEYTSMWDYHVESTIENIQLDAMKEGMRRAARIADEAQYKTEPRDCMCAILAATEGLTNKDL